MTRQSSLNNHSRQGRFVVLALLLTLLVLASPLNGRAQDIDDDLHEVITLDADGDELADEEELEIGTDPTLFDTDGDALSDGSEVREDGWGTDPLSPDTDGDGFFDADELFTHGTDPKDPESYPAQQEELSTINIEVRVLPVGYDGNDYIGDSVPVPAVEVIVAIPASEFGVHLTTDELGQASFPDLGEGEYMVILDIPGDAAEFMTIFGTEDGFEPRQHEGQDTNQPVVYLGPDEELNGLFYVIPTDAGQEPEPTPTTPPAQPEPKPTMEPVKQFPNTGSGDEVGDSNSILLVGAAALLGLVFAGLAVRSRRAA